MACFLVAGSLTLTGAQAQARDGFGNETPAGSSFGESAAALEDRAAEPSADDAIKLNEITPAAGGLADDQGTPDLGKAKTTEEKAGEELGEAYDTKAERTVVDHGKGASETQDTYGDGTVNVFQRQTDHGAVMDKDSAAGVQVKVLEFK